MQTPGVFGSGNHLQGLELNLPLQKLARSCTFNLKLGHLTLQADRFFCKHND